MPRCFCVMVFFKNIELSDRIKQAVDDYLADTAPDAALVFSDFRKIHESFRIMKVRQKKKTKV